MIAESLGISAVNMGMLASFGPALILDIGKSSLNPGDAVLLCFEYNAYSFDRHSDVSAEFVLGCYSDFYQRLPAREKLDVLLTIPALRYLKSRGGGIDLSCPEIQSPFSPVSRSAGDLDLKESDPPMDAQRVRRIGLYCPLDIALKRDSKRIRAPEAFFAWAQANSILVMATWPNTIAFKEYGADHDLKEIEEFFRSHGIAVIGNPESAMFPREDFYDTQYHLSRKSIPKRTSLLISGLKAHKEFSAHTLRWSVTNR